MKLISKTLESFVLLLWKSGKKKEIMWVKLYVRFNSDCEICSVPFLITKRQFLEILVAGEVLKLTVLSQHAVVVPAKGDEGLTYRGVFFM